MRRRLDQALVEAGLVTTRSRARDAIGRGLVRVAGAIVDKPGALVEAGAPLAVLPGAGVDFVSRGAVKLGAALDAFGLDPKNRIALDVGASTGGFTEVLLARGAAKVYAVDVGHRQLHERLRRDARVASLEDQDARTLSRASIPDEVGAVTADVSFISLAKALPAALGLAGRGAWLVALVKPQFEAGPDAVGKGGVVRDPDAREAAVASVSRWLARDMGWSVIGVVPSPIAGGSGNREYLLGARRD